MKHIKLFEQFEDPFGEEFDNKDISFINEIILKLIDGRLSYKWDNGGYYIYNNDEDYQLISATSPNFESFGNRHFLCDMKNNKKYDIDQSKFNRFEDAFFTSDINQGYEIR